MCGSKEEISLEKIEKKRKIVKWLDSTIMPYGFITMDGNVGFFHVMNVHGGVDYMPRPGDEISFFYDDYEKGAMDVRVLPTPTKFPCTPVILTREVEPHPSDDSWETDSCETPTTSKINNVIEDNGKIEEGKGREMGTVTSVKEYQGITLSPRQYGFINPDTYIPGRDSGSLSLQFYKPYLHAKDSGIKKGDKVTYYYSFSSTKFGPHHYANDIRVVDNDNG